MMDTRLFATVFATILLAEIADKTQIATLLYATDVRHSKLVVFVGSALALTVASAVAVFAGGFLSEWIDPKTMSRFAGVAFVAIGVWTILRA